MNTQTAQVTTQEKTVTLQPIAMVIPTKQGIYASSRIEQKKTIPYREFLTNFADNPRSILVSFATDGKSNPQLTTAYGKGLDCWYIIDEVRQ